MQPAPAAHAQSVHGCGHGQHGREKMDGWMDGWTDGRTDRWELGIEPWEQQWEVAGIGNDQCGGKSWR